MRLLLTVRRGCQIRGSVRRGSMLGAADRCPTGDSGPSLQLTGQADFWHPTRQPRALSPAVYAGPSWPSSAVATPEKRRSWPKRPSDRQADQRLARAILTPTILLM